MKTETGYEFRMFIENLQSNVTFLQDAAEDLYDDLDVIFLKILYSCIYFSEKRFK